LVQHGVVVISLDDKPNERETVGDALHWLTLSAA
jgi:hypothetical protein